MNDCGLILAAGKQNRFEDNNFKSLMPYNKLSTILDINIMTMKKYVKKIFIVVNINNDNSYFENIASKYDNVKLMEIYSGQGCGHAVLQALRKLKKNIDNIFLIWGDSINDDPKLYDICKKHANYHFVFPVKYELDPYVKFEVDKNNIAYKVKYSKYNEVLKSESGYHDFSLFHFNYSLIKGYLIDMHEKYYNNLKNTYKTKNNELIFLDLINEYGIDLNAQTIPMDNYNKSSNNSYNSIEEYKKILNNVK